MRHGERAGSDGWQKFKWEAAMLSRHISESARPVNPLAPLFSNLTPVPPWDEDLRDGF